MITKVYAVVSTAQLSRAHDWYARLFGRSSDLHPMAEVHEWYFVNGAVQLVADAERAGRSMLTVIVSNLDAIRAEMQTRDLALGPSSGGDFATVAQVRDPDGNQITFAEPATQVQVQAQAQTA